MPKELDMEKMLADVDKGKQPQTMGQTKPFLQQYEKPEAAKKPVTKEPPQMPTKSNMPKGGTQSPRGDLGALRQAESNKAGRQIKNNGPDMKPSSRLPYRKPETAIDAKFGPGDKICG
jgi:hypothetical protein